MILEVDRLGPYHLVEVLGKGGMGVVYLAEDTRSHEMVALKTVRTVHATESLSIRREIRALANLRHPGVVAVRDFGQWEGIPWYAMDLYKTETLREWQIRIWAPYRESRPAPPSSTTLDLSRLAGAVDEREVVPMLPTVPVAAGRLEEVLTIARRLLSPLSFLHARGFVHRDLKPSNVFLRAGLRPVLADFGLARLGALGSAREQLLDDWRAEGTPAYMAPEAIRGELVDARADLYAIGCMLYELCAGERPFIAPDDRGVLQRHLTATPTPLSSRALNVPPSLEELLTAMLQKAPSARPGDARDVIAVLESLGARPDPEDPPRNAPTPLYRPRLAGRDAALGTLVRGLDGARAGKGTVLSVSGQSGIGKTHLANEAARRVRGAIVVSGQCEPVAPSQQQAAGLPLHPLRPLLELLADRCAADPDESRRLLGDRGQILGFYAPRILDLPMVRVQPRPPDLAGSAERERLFVALLETLEALLNDEALVLVLDDLQWGDELTLEFLCWLRPEWVTARRFAVVATWRAEECTSRIQRLVEQPWVQRIELGELDAFAAHSLVRDMMAVARAPTGLVESLLATSKGTPFVIAEILRLAVLEGQLRRTSPTELTVEPGFDQLLLPLGDLVRRRLNRLGARERAVVDVACVFGRSFDLRLVHVVVGGGESELFDAINELVAQQILMPSDGEAFLFAHDKLVEHAYRALEPEARVALNRTVAETLERHLAGKNSLREFHAELAHHWREAGDLLRARGHIESAANVAFDAAAYDQARAHLEYLLSTPDVPDRIRAAWEQRIGECAWNLGDLDGAERWTRAAFESLGQPLPTTLLGWLARLSGAVLEQGLHRLGVFPFASRSEDDRHVLHRLGVAANVLCWRFLFKDDLVGLATMSVLGANWVERGSPRVRLATAYGWIAYNAGVSRLSGLANAYFKRGREDALAEKDQPGHVFVLLIEGIYHGGLGHWSELRRISDEALSALERMGDPQNVENHLTNLATGEHLTGNFARSSYLFEQIYESATRRGNDQHIAWGLYGACWGLIGAGKLDEAQPRAERAWAMLQEKNDFPSEINTSSMLALIHLRRGDLAAARSAKDEARSRVARMRGAVYPVVPGIVALADALIELVDVARKEGSDMDAAVAEARTQLMVLWVISQLFPFAGPIHLRCRGAFHAAQGSERGRRLLKKAVTACAERGLAYEAAQAGWLLGRYYPDERATAWADARARCEAIGAGWHLGAMNLQH